jgi:1-deoxy-D-xylulose-5-phosphate synthase
MEKPKPDLYLNSIKNPKDLRLLPETELLKFCEELRNYLIEHCSVYGGHFGASLGVVELTTALHYVYNTPEDLLVWDVGHQAYGHKILTGRKDQFHTNRIYGGISGFPKRSESEYDAFGVGHSSTSISAALGMAVANAYLKKNNKHIAVIGDGAMTAGLAFEGLNHAGSLKNTDLLVILNDNCMSIDPNVGALKDYLIDITTSKTYNKLREEAWKWLGKLKKYGADARKLASKLETYFTASATKPGILFENLGFRYFGPIDGHDVLHLVHVLKDLKNIKGPKLLHIVTVKGKGFEPAEKDQTFWHAPSYKFNPVTGELFKPKNLLDPKPPKYQNVFGETIIELAKLDDRIMGITPAMPSGSSLNLMMEVMPERAFDVGIAEQHAVTFSAGLATQGLIPFCNIYSSFMQRAYDQVIHDVAIQDLKVIFCLDRSGVVGADGATHHGLYDLAYMRCIPNLIVSAPMNEMELRNLMYTAAHDSNKHPFVIRYPRGEGVTIDWKKDFELIEIGKGQNIIKGKNIAILSIGHIGNIALNAIYKLHEEEIYPSLYDMRFVKPLDEELLHYIAKNYSAIITIEDGCLMGGFGSAILEFMAEHQYFLPVKRLGAPDKVIEHGTQKELYKECFYDENAVIQTVKNLVFQYQ